METLIDNLVNGGSEPIFATSAAKIFPGGRIVSSRLCGQLSLGARSQLGPDAVAGRYLGINSDSYIARATTGSFCSFGSRVSINPLNHPTNWLSIHEFQYHETAYAWDKSYCSVRKLPHPAAQNNPRVHIGHDVWIGHNATVLEGVTIGDGAVIGVGTVVTKDVPPYAIVVGVPGQVKRYRFPEKTIERLLVTRWWDLDLRDLQNVDFRNIEVALAEIERIQAGLR